MTAYVSKSKLSLLPDITVNGCVIEAHCSECLRSFYGSDVISDPESYNHNLTLEFEEHIRRQHTRTTSSDDRRHGGPTKGG